MNPETKHEMLTQGMGHAVSWTAIFNYLFGLNVEKWAAFAGLVWIVVQTAHLLWRWHLRIKHEKERVAKGLPPPAAITSPGKL